jgi:hypothetical protein
LTIDHNQMHFNFIFSDILCLVCEGCKADSVSVLLSGSEGIGSSKEQPLFQQGLLPGVLDVLHSRMTTWPPLPHVICWCSMQIQVHSNLMDIDKLNTAI